MTRTLQLKNVDIKYWIGEYPQNKSIMSEKYCNKYNVNNKIDLLQPQKLALEVYMHRNANNYGILGVEYIPKQGSETIDVEIVYIKENQVKYASELLQYSDYMYYGLPKECLNTVREKVKLYMDKEDFSGGNLLFRFAVNSEVGSSPSLFGIMAEMLLEFIVKRNIYLTKIDNDKVVEQIFLNSAFINSTFSPV